MVKHFVTFLSPGTFVHEETTKEIGSWDVNAAVAMAATITERHQSHPFCFYFTTRELKPGEFDHKETKRSGRYYLGGTVRTIDQVFADNLPDENILRSNMRSNGYKRIVTTNSPWRMTQPLKDEDVVIPAA